MGTCMWTSVSNNTQKEENDIFSVLIPTKDNGFQHLRKGQETKTVG